MNGLNVCKHCGYKTKTEKWMIKHLVDVHGIHLSEGYESLFDGGFEKLKEDFKGILYRNGDFYN